ncbi:YaiO family outer membrane beta-barrel protein [Billgrantia sp. LNSP4103-1]|uniref:YaiO family outer membrane beta-barrel protein n=1 Tax=Billgrantia sp. LNSP4103-1 TaxID=3410266 RepID=UPI00403F4CD3
MSARGDAKSTARRVLVLGSVLALCAYPFTAVSQERRTEAEVSQRYDTLDNGYDDWLAQRLELQSARPGAAGWYGEFLRERRYRTWDEGFLAGLAIPLGEEWVVQPEFGRNFSADFLPDWHVDLRVQRAFIDGYVGSVSVRRTRYEASQVDRLALGLERYWGNWRGAYTLNASKVASGGTPVGHALALDYYYGERSVVGMRAAIGREEEGLPDGRVVTTEVESLALRGRHWFQPEWAVTWEVGALSQGELYDRYGIQLGLRHAF